MLKSLWIRNLIRSFALPFPVFFSLLELCFAGSRSPSTMQQQITKHGIIPDVITMQPRNHITVEYSKKVVANFGNKLKTPDLKKKPWLQWSADPELYYTLILTDPDSPSRAEPKNREWLLWLVVNIPGFDVKSGDTIVDYMRPDAGKGTGSHRFIFLTYQQPSVIYNFNETKVSSREHEGRANFSTQKFCDKYRLGSPWASNFFHAEWFDKEKDAIENHPGIKKRRKEEMKEAFIEHGLIPHYLHGLPRRDLQVEFKGGKKANFGNVLKPSQTQQTPYLQWSADPDHYYAVIMIDFDAPDAEHHAWREWLHWMVVNIPSFDVEAGDILTQYLGPNPGANTGFHRYIFTVFSQGNDTIKFHEPLRVRSDLESRQNFSTYKFAEKYKLGPAPWALNFIRVQYSDNSVEPYDDQVEIITENVDPFESDQDEDEDE
nr:PREDICTED: uncharacterized protein LOC109038462 [Bemisia tabaci]XP_018909051.1 PREDICTED: uncharacterized protein LOC109038462 [Bemisia tabaci]